MSTDPLSPDAQDAHDVNTITPLDGEAGIPSVTQARPFSLSRKGIFTIALMALFLIGVLALGVNRALANHKKDTDDAGQRQADRPTAAATEPRKLDLTPAPTAKAPAPAGPLIPAITPLPDDAEAEPIGVRRTGEATAHGPNIGSGMHFALEDAPVVLVSSPSSMSAQPQDKSQGAAHASAQAPAADELNRPGSPNDPIEQTTRNLEAYQRQLQSLLDTLTKNADAATAGPGGALPPTAAGLSSTIASSGTNPVGVGPIGGQHGGQLFGGQLQGTETRRVYATLLGNRSLTLPKGTAFTCALKTKVISAVSGLVGCQVQRNVYSDDGRVLLIERGSHMDGEYRITSVRPGTVRIPVLWTRIRTPQGVVVDIDSPGTGALGESGIDGYVDNRWGERIGAALLLSVIDDSVKLAISNQANGATGNTVVFPSTTENASKLAEKVLDSTINIPPLIYQNQGGIVGIYVAHDVDFSPVYELQVQPRKEPR